MGGFTPTATADLLRKSATELKRTRLSKTDIRWLTAGLDPKGFVLAAYERAALDRNAGQLAVLIARGLMRDDFFGKFYTTEAGRAALANASAAREPLADGDDAPGLHSTPQQDGGER